MDASIYEKYPDFVFACLRHADGLAKLLILADRLHELALDRRLRLRAGLELRKLRLVELLALHLALLLEARDDARRLPAEVRRELPEAAVLPVVLQAEALQRCRNYHALLLVVRVRNTVERLQAVQGQRTAGGLVREHPADSAPEDLARRPVVDVALGVLRREALALEVRVLQLVAVQRAGHVNVLRPNTHDLLAIENLLRDHGAQPAKQMAFAINDDLLLEHQGKLSK